KEILSSINLFGIALEIATKGVTGKLNKFGEQVGIGGNKLAKRLLDAVGIASDIAKKGLNVPSPVELEAAAEFTGAGRGRRRRAEAVTLEETQAAIET